MIAKRKRDREEQGTLTISFALSRLTDKSSLLDGIACLDKNFMHSIMQDYKEAYVVS